MVHSSNLIFSCESTDSQTEGDKSRAGQLNDQDILLQKTRFKGGQGSCLNDQAILLQKTLSKVDKAVV